MPCESRPRTPPCSLRTMVRSVATAAERTRDEPIYALGTRALRKGMSAAPLLH